MPNHVQNQLTIKSDNLDEILKSIAGDELLDFNKIIHMPDGLQMEMPNHIIEYAKYVFDPQQSDRSKWSFDLLSERGRVPNNFDDTDWNLFLQCLTNLRKTGFAYWYDWSNSHWGTKWNAYDFPEYQPAKNIIRFSTAWNTPMPVIKEMSRLHPEAEISLAYASEDMGYHLGVVVFHAGEIVQENYPNFGTDVAWVQAYKLRFPDFTEDEIREDVAEWYEDEPDRAAVLTALILEKTDSNS